MFLSGCVASETIDRPVQSAGVTSKVWSLRQLDGEHVKHTEPEAATIRFRSDHGIVGTSVCNDVGGNEFAWSADPTGMKGAFKRDQTGATIVTVVGCLDKRATDVADRFWAKMQGAGRWSLQGERLRIAFTDGSAAELMPAATPASKIKPSCAAGDQNNFDCRKSQ
ncbi:META domain-containing protein [Sphingomonas sp. PB2P12]|uniref:META domain-containing protein n=1 Tax=Sphingomonas sandaracina TaxID=3096157 RepID=UPI003B536E8E